MSRSHQSLSDFEVRFCVAQELSDAAVCFEGGYQLGETAILRKVKPNQRENIFVVKGGPDLNLSDKPLFEVSHAPRNLDVNNMSNVPRPFEDYRASRA